MGTVSGGAPPKARYAHMNSSVTTAIKLAVVLAFAAAGACIPLLSRAQQMTAPPYAASMPWRPNKPFDEAGYVGAAACVKCHEEESKTQHETAMGRALETVADSRVLRSNPRMTFRFSPYTFQIERRGDQSIYSVTDGTRTVSEPILYSFGQGKAGQTYIYRRNGIFYESRVSYYRDINGLDFTIGYERSVPPSLEDALGRAISMDEARSCFSCHSTGAVYGKNLQLDKLMPGVSCESCHGPGRDHLAAMEAKQFLDKKIFNPGRMGADELTQEFCGSCHRSAESVMTLAQHGGINNVRFQPYRIFTSRGHDPNDDRLSCTACHNPHQNLRERAADYDSNCLACHQSAAARRAPRLARVERADGRTAKPCPVGSKDCTSCHMPKIEIPGSHFKFTDHRIRIVRPGEPFPK
jgi:hypothetical protein